MVWHDVECGSYDADLPLWRDLAREAPEGVLDVGAGTGRVALRLAYAGHDVTALDLDPELLAVLERRAADAGVTVKTMAADAERLRAPRARRPRRRADADDPAARDARRLLRQRPPRAQAGRPASRWRSRPTSSPTTATRRCRPRTWARPTAGPTSRSRSRSASTRSTSRSSGSASAIGPDGERETADDLIELQVVTPGGLAEEAAAHGLHAEELRHIPETPEHVAAQVVIFRG